MVLVLLCSPSRSKDVIHLLERGWAPSVWVLCSGRAPSHLNSQCVAVLLHATQQPLSDAENGAQDKPFHLHPPCFHLYILLTLSP